MVTDGDRVLPLSPAQDYKRLDDGDTGPNTGGMGAYSRCRGCSSASAARSPVDEVTRTVAEPVVRQLDAEGTPFIGLLIAGLILTPTASRSSSSTPASATRRRRSLLLETPLGGLPPPPPARPGRPPPLRWRDGAAVTVVVAAGNYPGTPRTGDVITGADRQACPRGAARRAADGALRLAGGRVLCGTATGPTLAAARNAAYELVGIELAGSHPPHRHRRRGHRRPDHDPRPAGGSGRPVRRSSGVARG